MAMEPRRGHPPPDAPDRRRRLHIHGITEMPASYDAEVAEPFCDLRAASNMSEEDLAATLSTRVEVVQALEQGALFALPPWTETCRVVTGYGTLLNLDVRPLLRRIYAQIEAGIVESRPKAMPDLPVMPQTQDADFEFPETAGEPMLPQGAPQPPEPPAWPEPPPLAPDRRSEPRQGSGRPINRHPSRIMPIRSSEANQAKPPGRSSRPTSTAIPAALPDTATTAPIIAAALRPQQSAPGQQAFPQQPPPPAAPPQAYGNAPRQTPASAPVANGRDVTAPVAPEEKAPRRGLLKWGIVAPLSRPPSLGYGCSWRLSEPPRRKRATKLRNRPTLRPIQTIRVAARPIVCRAPSSWLQSRHEHDSDREARQACRTLGKRPGDACDEFGPGNICALVARIRRAGSDRRHHRCAAQSQARAG